MDKFSLSELIAIRRALGLDLARLIERGGEIASGKLKGIRPSENAMEAGEVKGLYDRIGKEIDAREKAKKK